MIKFEDSTIKIDGTVEESTAEFSMLLREFRHQLYFTCGKELGQNIFNAMVEIANEK